MTYIDDLRGINEENLRIFAYWGSVLVVKILAMVVLIGRWRWGERVIFIKINNYFCLINH